RQEFEDALGLLLIDSRQREADMDQDVFAGLDVADMFQAYALADAAEIHLAHEHIVLAVCFHNLAWNSKAHERFLPPSLCQFRRGNRYLAQAKPPTFWRNEPVPVHAETALPQVSSRLGAQKRVEEYASAQSHVPDSRPLPNPVAHLDNDFAQGRMKTSGNKR